MSKEDELSRLSEADLLQAYVDNVQMYETLDHIGAMNRMMDKRRAVFDEIERRSGGSLQPLRTLLDHPDPHVRHSAAVNLRTIDHAAFEKTVSALAERTDEIGRDARESLKWDEHFQAVGYPESRSEAPAPRSLPPAMLWQCDNPPPEGMNRDELRHLLVTTFATPIADRLLELAQPAIGLWPQRPPSDLPATASRLGGQPYVPADWSWPMVDTEPEAEPMIFLGQINCADLQGYAGADVLPSSGLLSFFGDHDAVMGCDYGDSAVFHWPETGNLVAGTAPIEPATSALPALLRFRPVINLPDQWSRVVAELFPDEEERKRYADVCRAVHQHRIPQEATFYCSFGKLLGWPALVQWHDLDCPCDMSDPNSYRLLLQLDDYANGDDIMGWGPGGSLYFLMHDADLRAGRFEDCEFEFQVT